MRSLFAYSTAIGLACLVSGAAFADDALTKLAGMRFYSDLSFVPEEGEFVGQQIVIIPYDHGETKALWRTANGVFDAPLLLDVVKRGDILKIKEPGSGEWTFQIKGAFLEGVSSRGVKLRLKQVSLK